VVVVSEHYLEDDERCYEDAEDLIYKISDTEAEMKRIDVKEGENDGNGGARWEGRGGKEEYGN